MSHLVDRRVALAFAGTGLVWSGLLLPSNAAAAAQGSWRFCHKCSSLFYDGFPAKGVCAAGGAHEAAGLVFVLPYDLPETPKAQSHWRFCGKCSVMFYNGTPQKGACPAHGGHEAHGFEFTLPHSTPETPTSQGKWRFCGRCEAMFFNGSPAKGACPAGGGHQAVGLDFTLPYETDYPNKLTKLSQPNGQLQRVLKEAWDDVGRAVVAERVQKAVNGREFKHGTSGYNAHASIGDMTAAWSPKGPLQWHVVMTVPGNNVEFHTTTPTVFGSYADPAFRVGFGLVVEFDLAVHQGNPPITLGVTRANTTNASVHGSNATGTIVETVADFWTHGAFSRTITDEVNNDQQFQKSLAGAVTKAIDRSW